jgi:hypothetical protein
LSFGRETPERLALGFVLGFVLEVGVETILEVRLEVGVGAQGLGQQSCY